MDILIVYLDKSAEKAKPKSAVEMIIRNDNWNCKRFG